MDDIGVGDDCVSAAVGLGGGEADDGGKGEVGVVPEPIQAEESHARRRGGDSTDGNLRAASCNLRVSGNTGDGSGVAEKAEAAGGRSQGMCCNLEKTIKR